MELTKFVHGVPMLFVEGQFHEDADGGWDLMLHRRRHYNMTRVFTHHKQTNEHRVYVVMWS